MGNIEQVSQRADDEAWEMECLEYLRGQLDAFARSVLELRRTTDQTQTEIAKELGATNRQVERAYEQIIEHSESARNKFRSGR